VTFFLLEAYLPGSSAGDLVALAERLSDAAHALSKGGMPVQYLRSTYVPEDETCFHYVEASTASIAACLAERAELSFDRILEARNASVAALPVDGDAVK
jgi:hypothetical protein